MSRRKNQEKKQVLGHLPNRRRVNLVTGLPIQEIQGYLTIFKETFDYLATEKVHSKNKRRRILIHLDT